jgi:hypothetical protein
MKSDTLPMENHFHYLKASEKEPGLLRKQAQKFPIRPLSDLPLKVRGVLNLHLKITVGLICSEPDVSSK